MNLKESRLASLIYGLTLPARALGLILSKPVLIFWSLLPIGITLALYGYLIRGLTAWAHSNLQHFFQSWGWNPDGWAAGALLILARILLFVVGALTFSFVASISSAPFNDTLAEKAERWTTP